MEIKQYVSKQPTGYWINQWEMKKFLEINDHENMTTQNLWYAAKEVLRGSFSNTILPQEIRKTE